MGIVTRTGDRGKTRLLSGEEIAKADPRIEAFGVLDELNSHIGLARALTDKYGGKCNQVAREMQELQLDLVRLASELACTDPSALKFVEPTAAHHVEHIEKRIEALEKEIKLPRSFIIPGACEASAAMDIARSVARRLERQVAQLAQHGAYGNEQGVIYLNRLSDYLFMLARYIERSAGVAFCTKENP